MQNVATTTTATATPKLSYAQMAQRGREQQPIESVRDLDNGLDIKASAKTIVQSNCKCNSSLPVKYQQPGTTRSPSNHAGDTATRSINYLREKRDEDIGDVLPPRVGSGRRNWGGGDFHAATASEKQIVHWR